MKYPFLKIVVSVFLFTGILVVGWFGVRSVRVSPDHTGLANVVIVQNGDNSQTVRAVSGGYHFTIPSNWMVESTGMDGVAIYPISASSSFRTCKLEASVFDNASHRPLEEWVRGRLYQDPTVVVRETSLSPVSVSHEMAVRWDGFMDDMPTTLVYVSHGEKIYEIAPSSLDGHEVSSGTCASGLGQFISAFSFN